MRKETTLSYKGSLECPVKSIITEARYIRGRIILLFKVSLIIIALFSFVLNVVAYEYE
jgi:hypothetical protein